MTKDDLNRCILKVTSPTEGSAFVVGDGRYAVTCLHVCAPDGNLDLLPEIKFEYSPALNKKPIKLTGEVLLDESDPSRDIIVVKLHNLPNHPIPSAKMSLDDQPRTAVIASGYPSGQNMPEPIRGVILDAHHVTKTAFKDSKEFEILRIDTRANPGSYEPDPQLLPGMSGGPIWNAQTGTVIAVIQGMRSRNFTVPPEGFGIQLKHLKTCSKILSPHIYKKRSSFARSIWVWIASIVIIFLAMFMLNSLKCFNNIRKIEGEIIEPAPQDTLGRTFNCSGIVYNPRPEIHFWLVVESRDEAAGRNLYWPKTEIIPDSQTGKWSIQIYEDGVLQKVSLSLWAVKEQGQERLQKWYDSGSKPDRFPPMTTIEDMVRLHRIDRIYIQ